MNKEQIEAGELARYLSGNSSEKEKIKVDAWINGNPENRRKFDDFKRIWKTAGIQHIADSDKMLDAQEDWKKINFRVKETKATVSSGNTRPKDGTFEGPGYWQSFMRLAAVFLIAGFIGIVAYQYLEPPAEPTKQSSLREITTDVGQRVNLTLSDGTKVLLNAESKIELPKVFDSDRREVFLEGQAYFNVAKNKEKPFIINSGNAQTRVLGTSFSVRAYPGDERITIAVKEGKVAFQTNIKEGGKTVVNSREVAQYDMKTHQLRTQKMEDMGLYLGWVEGYLKFKEAPMQEVAIELERRYGVSVTFADQELKKQPLTAVLKSRSIQNVLDVISMSLNINYEINDNQVIFQE